MRSEEEVLGFWARKKIFDKSVRKGGTKTRPFVFFEGPPYANGMPGIHHVEARAFKDVVARYKTMRGFRVGRRAGWDTHGLPTEMAVEKKLGIKSKREIEEKIGLRAFVEAARADVFLYKAEFERMSERMGYWLDFKNAYVTMHSSYIESLWWIIKQFHEKGFLYEDDKILPWCVRCGTALSSHELAQGYKKVVDQSIYIRVHLKTRRAALLVWTTTPWTLPANVAIAVSPDLEYVTVEEKGEKFIVLALLAEKIFPGLKPLWREKGENLVGLEYEPPFPSAGNPYRVVPADFISSEEGTGMVHIAPAFGEDDMHVGKRENLPVFNTIDDEGRFTDAVPAWRGIFVKDADEAIIKDLDQKGFLWRREAYEHEYPFCWRCDTPLIYRARKSWWVRVSKIRKELVQENSKVSWHPPYFKEGRFGAWLCEAKDWAFSRERYWGAPLPVWRCKGCGDDTIIGSIAEFKKHARLSSNSYYLLRHGFAKNNLKDIASSFPEGDTFGLTPRGKTEIRKTARALRKAGIDLIISSDLTRAKESAAILTRELGAPVLYEEDLRDLHVSDFERKQNAEHTAYLEGAARFTTPYPGSRGESWNDLKTRMYGFFVRTEKLHQDKKILVVGHADPLWFLESIIKGDLEPEIAPKAKYLKNGGWHKILPSAVPRNDRGELDLHRPYIDEVELTCQSCGGAMARMRDVVDVWFDSGAMPYAAWHYPFENRARIDKKISYPADFIAEGIDQTRGWFYVLLAVSVLLGNGAPYKNVMSLGHVLDKNGKKMSKRLGNSVDPMKLFEKHGADAVRWYFFTINHPDDSKLFNEEDIVKAKRNFLDLLLNTLRFYELYGGRVKKEKVTHMLDRWIVAKLAVLADDVTRMMDAYDIVGAARAIENFTANDVSRWYVRRSRDRMKEGKGLLVLRTVLLDIARLAAPFAPFTAEVVYRALGGAKESVHLEEWPAKRMYLKKILRDMEEVRAIAARGLQLRARAGIKVRQPLGTLTIKKTSIDGKEYFNILKEELNVKEIIVSAATLEDLALDTVITRQLKQEGEIRDMIRALQDMRKKVGLAPRDSICVHIRGSKDAFERSYKKEIARGARAEKFLWDAKPAGTGDNLVTIGEFVIVGIEKV